jgi:hypothetical protein
VGALPGSIQFSVTGFSGAESAGLLNLTVSRVGGSTGAISAQYTTTDGTAHAGLDFTQTTGTVSWADGDAANKVIAIPLVNDGVAEGGETFTVTLSNPTGVAGVFLGIPSMATAIITESWPAGGTIPGGFLTPNGSAGAWTAVTDQAYEGSSSLRSAQVFGPNMSTYANSDLTYSGSFNAGTVAFAYRVSSYPSYGVLDFLVDGVVVYSDTGESGWKSYSSTLSAGSHSLIWRFKNRLTSACPNWNPPPPGGAACADRAWIDALVLPLALASASTTLVSMQNPASFRQTVTLTATVSGSAPSPSGYVVFRDGSSVINGCAAVPLVAGSAQCLTVSMASGAHSVTAQYSGDLNYATSTSSPLTQTISKKNSLAAILMLLLD